MKTYVVTVYFKDKREKGYNVVAPNLQTAVAKGFRTVHRDLLHTVASVGAKEA